MARRYFSGVPRSIQYAEDTKPNTGAPAAISSGNTSRSMFTRVPGTTEESASGSST